MNEDFNWEQAEEAVARARATFEDYAPTAEEAALRQRKNEENRLAALKGRMREAIHQLSREAWGESDAPTHGLEYELQIFREEVEGALDAMPPSEAADWLAGNFGAIEHLHARTGKERWHALRALVGLRGSADYTADLLEDNAAPAPAEGPTATEGTSAPTPTDEDEDEDALDEMLRRLARANDRIKEEVAEPGYSRHSGLERDLYTFCDVLVYNLRKIPPRLALMWLGAHLATLEALRARNEQERQHALLVLRGLRGNLYYTIAHILDDEPPAVTAREEDEDEDEDEIPWDDEDDGEEEEFHAAATREIVQAYRQTAVCIRENLIARFREAAERLGRQASEHSPDPWRRGLNDDLGRFMGRVEVVIRGICPLEAHTWLESNIEEFEALQANNPREYEQTERALSGLSDRLFGLLYEISREK
jgi:hypothetical protein